MNGPIENEDEKPLDPATERVRRKLAKTGAVFMGLNMLALMAVLGAIVYKLSASGKENPQPPTSAGSAVVPVEPGFEKNVDIPDGARLVSATENNGRVLLNLLMPSGQQALWFYDIASGQVIGRLNIQ
jgi:hypothetical protein